VSNSILVKATQGSLAELLVRIAKICQIILMARLLEPEDMGRYNYALTLFGLFSVVFDFGLLPVAVKEFSQNSDKSTFFTLVYLKLSMSFVGILLLTASCLYSPIGLQNTLLTLGICLSLALNDIGVFVIALYRARGEFWREAFYRVFFSIIQLAFSATVIILTHNLDYLALCLILTGFLATIPLIKECRTSNKNSKYSITLGSIKNYFTQCLPLAGSVLAGSIYLNYDSVILANYASLEEVAWYGLAVKTIFGILIMPAHFLLSATLPYFAKVMSTSSKIKAIRKNWIQIYVRIMTFGAFSSLLLAIFSRQIIFLMFGDKYEAAAPIVCAFSMISFLFYFYTPLSQWLLLNGKQKKSFKIFIFGSLINIVLVNTFISRWGLWGAFFATLVTHISISVGHAIAVFKGSDFVLNQSEKKSTLKLVLAMCFSLIFLNLQLTNSIFSSLIAILIFFSFSHQEIIKLYIFFKKNYQNYVN
jgi:O-antigen/teichoic acid export membrane protein